MICGVPLNGRAVVVVVVVVVLVVVILRLVLKAGCAPCLAGCRWNGICTKWLENLLFEVILMAF